jgi:hypothetical protein
MRAYILHLQVIGNVASHFNDPQVSKEDAAYSIFLAKEILYYISDSGEEIFREDFIDDPVEAVDCPQCGVVKGEKCQSREGFAISTLHVARKNSFDAYKSRFDDDELPQ